MGTAKCNGNVEVREEMLPARLGDCTSVGEADENDRRLLGEVGMGRLLGLGHALPRMILAGIMPDDLWHVWLAPTLHPSIQHSKIPQKLSLHIAITLMLKHTLMLHHDLRHAYNKWDCMDEILHMKSSAIRDVLQYQESCVDGQEWGCNACGISRSVAELTCGSLSDNEDHCYCLGYQACDECIYHSK